MLVDTVVVRSNNDHVEPLIINQSLTLVTWMAFNKSKPYISDMDGFRVHLFEFLSRQPILSPIQGDRVI